MKGFITLFLLSAILPAQAGVVIYGTRVIYPADKKEITVQLMNQSPRTSLVQSWIDDGDSSLPPEKIHVPFVLSPAIVRVSANSGQQIKIKQTPNMLPANKESLFYLNVLDIPPNSSSESNTSVLKLAMQNRVKLFYRPKGIAGISDKTFSQLEITRRDNQPFITNNTANWVTITAIKTANIQVNNDSVMLAPFSKQVLSLKNILTSSYSLTIIDDSGNTISHKLSVK
ncbi:fimbria/pilus periplasmic chaperone [unidentified bacterial endosymbiont]|uniref:fimbria/pilus periplasmic chaperone n=1 Tax=unidentified bacterial endosymbiont TaxID=2355 RepID=UPI00209DC38D|nr:fimbria/pilus periplasmic chaperone [unidentified bacterial endosymbiont]